MPAAVHRERLHVPLSYWLLALAFALSLVVAIGAYLGPWWALGVAAASMAVVALLLLSYGHAQLVVDERGVQAGRALLTWPHVGAAEALDRGEAREALGVGANVAAYYLTRPYTPGAVRIQVRDHADPHPYWLVSSRHAQKVAEAINAQHSEQES